MRKSFAAPIRVALVGLALAAGSARAVDLFAPPPPSALIETSIRSAAMGGAGAAVMWGEPGVWANPATLYGVHGIGWVTGHTDLSARRDPGPEFSSQRVLIGGGGLGVSLMGQPIDGLGKAQIDAEGALPLGGTFEAFDRTQGWGVGVSPLRVIDSFRKLSGDDAGPLTSYGEVAFGYHTRESEAQVSPGNTVPEAQAYDWGVTGRLSLSRWWGADAPFRVYLAGAYSQSNVLESDQDNPSATTLRMDRTGFALHL